ncbi:NUDIX hydrolase [Mucilaginibacter koreensis]
MQTTEDNPWQVTAAQPVYDNPWIQVTEYQVINPAGNPGIYGKVHFKNLAIGVVPLDEDMNTYLVGQYRFTMNKYSWEIPAGGCPVDTEPLATAQRELLEETGLKAAKWRILQHMDLSNSVSDEESIVYLAQDLQQHEAEPEETEQLIIKKLPFSEAYRMVCNQEITDSMSVAGILKVQLLLLEGSL